MSNDEVKPPARRRTGRNIIAVVAAAVVVGALGGWLIHQGTSGPDEGGTAEAASATDQRGTTLPVPTASPSPAGEAADDKAADDKAPPGPLAGKVVVIDPGHNPTNYKHTKEINAPVRIGTTSKECDTTGTETNNGYTEATFTLDVSHRLRDLLEAKGATVKLTYDNDRPFGPCVDERAAIGNKAKADAALSIHADGAAAGNRGFHVILPGLVKGDGADTSKITTPSRALGTRIADDFARSTGSSRSNYIGDGTGLDTRTDLGGLNLSTVPKVFIECGNMRDAKDAALVTSSGWRQKAAQGLADGISAFLLK
ncbi:N-acetylmuramoyl-L-alanine amidase [Streptomyces sp. 150FB]|uniref:N-acetylmuramoyl-L-alanine amidase n=1 Tax=Streptomyces sp. 150FB TaxID=1576605 RepID=UPI00058936A3|nr:N-acetylmuramoyl-L-alanine amidase [Streptomyces sp. 150FB]KIF74248.1 N-acetylmuramoyl-L-alanine amidase [Streptomyces sp. 150FB]